MSREYLIIQEYYRDKWVNTNHKSMASVLKELKNLNAFKDSEVHSMPIGTSWFEEDTYYIIDCMGHYYIYRGITEFNREYLKEPNK